MAFFQKILLIALTFAALGTAGDAHAQKGGFGNKFGNFGGPNSGYDGVVTNNTAGCTGVPSSGFAGSVGTITTCADVRKTSGGGKSIEGGTAGFTPSTTCFSGGGYGFPVEAHTFMCAGATIDTDPSLDIDWPEFDVTYDKNDTDAEKEKKRLEWYGLSTRDVAAKGGTGRARSGKNIPLFLNAHDVCRKIDNSAGALESLFMDFSSAETWRTVHGVPAGGDPNGGYSRYANRSDLSSVKMSVCCSPVRVNICGSEIITQYAEVGDVVSMFGVDGGFATMECAGNNNFVLLDVHGICGSGNSGGGEAGGGNGYSNPNTGGTISASDWSGLSSDVQSSLSASGYGPTTETTTNATGVNDVAQATAEAEEAAAAEAAEIAAEEAAQAAAEAEAESESDSDGESDD